MRHMLSGWNNTLIMKCTQLIPDREYRWLWVRVTNRSLPGGDDVVSLGEERDGWGGGTPLLWGWCEPGGQVEVKQAIGEGAWRLRWDQENTRLVGVKESTKGQTTLTITSLYTIQRGLLLDLTFIKKALSNGSQMDVLEWYLGSTGMRHNYVIQPYTRNKQKYLFRCKYMKNT